MGWINTKSGASIWGALGRAPEVKFVGEKQTALCSFSVAIGKEKSEDGQDATKWANCKAWRKIGETIGCWGLDKGDIIRCDGYWSSNEYNGKTFWDFNVEFAARMASGGEKKSPSAKPEETPPDDASLDDEDLPF